MKLNAKAACTWLAVPLAAIAIAACGGDDGVTALPPDSGGSGPGQCENAECGDEILDECDTAPPTEECDGTNDCTEECMQNVCGDGYLGAGEACDDGNDVDGDGCSNCQDPDCGDSIVDEDEECDDGNNENGDGCTNACLLPECGDGIVQAASEECDEGEDNGADSNCTEDCTENFCGDGYVGGGEACDEMGATEDCTADCGLPTCGDGEMQGNEECDDENGNDRDECLSSCVLNTCGDGQVLAGTEACDDGNTDNTDSCTNACASAECGDGFVGPGEGCDDGEDNADDGECTTACALATCGDEVVQDGEDCDDGNNNTADGCNNCVAGTCGDGIRQDPEECDDSNTSNSDACTNDCLNAVCGDTYVGPGEACDDGNVADGDGCQANCADPTCGDGIVDAGEDCDDENADNTDDCLDTCQAATCGDGAVLAGVEECDDGDTVDGNQCTNSCTNAGCGDGIVGPGEGCDDGNLTDGDGCQADCSLASCGDGIVDAGEACDDANANNEDTCTNFCTSEACGDGFNGPNEACDDGNASNNDDCTTVCLDNVCGDGFRDPAVESCDDGMNNGPGQPCSDQCTQNSCGDGAIDPGEECDDGNNNNNDSCTTLCLWNVCGDGALYISVTDNDNDSALEECDDANTNEADLCLATCRYSRCADGTILTNNGSEPYDDPDGTGVMTASRGGLNDVYHSGPAGSVDNLTPALLDGDDGGADACDPGEVCRIGMLHETGVIPNGSGLSPVDISHIDNEECDDGNLTNTDACLARNEDADNERECRDAYCNDGEVQAGAEQCDDGCGPGIAETACAALRNPNDSCLDTCMAASCGDGWLYTDNTSGSATPPLEECDDGNTVGGDACEADCTDANCGNGVIDFTINADGSLRLEECDLPGGNSNAGTSTCSTSCRLMFPAAATNDFTCGNGALNTGEECDDGNLDNNDSCLNNCMLNECGDGARYIVRTTAGATPDNPNALEQCDDGNDNDEDSCLSTCRWATCGDNEEYRKETDGVTAHGNGLNDNIDAVGPNDCNDTDPAGNEDSIPLYNDCNAPATSANTGAPDGDVIPEECDDGNTVNNDLCSNTCEDAVCGDAILQAGEECDDGNAFGTDACLSLTDGIDIVAWCAGLANCDDACEASCIANGRTCTFNVCGDGFQSPFEACDDGNSNDSDSCHNDCSVSTCGNGTPGEDPDSTGPLPAEDCDDGNTTNTDSCTNICLYARCGDGFLQVGNGEECDDGNLINTDGCTSACTLPTCGDGVRNQASEQCDPGRDINDNDLLVDDDGVGGDPGSWLYASHENVDAPSIDLPPMLRDDQYLDEPFFCNPNTCQIRCDAQAGDTGRAWKENNSWCVFAAEIPGALNSAGTFNDDNAAFGSYTIYNSSTGAYDPELQQEGWAGARAHCQSLGIDADLVVVRNTTENGQLLTLVDGADDDFWWWLGLNDVGTQVQEPNGVWQWLDGTPTDTYRNWSGPPDTDTRPDDSGSDEDCGAFAPTDLDGFDEPPGTWNDLVCQHPDVYFACEFQLPSAAN